MPADSRRPLSAFIRMERLPECLAADLPGPRPAQTLEQGTWATATRPPVFLRGTRMRRTLATFVLWALAASAAAADNPLLGSWRLVAAIPGSMEDSSPNGVR